MLNPLTIISFFWLISEIVLSRLLKSGRTGRDYDKSSLTWLWITIILCISVGVSIAMSGYGSLSLFPAFFYYSGIVLISAGLLIRWMAILSLKKSFTVDVSIAEGQILKQTGLYKNIRHPSYFGSLLSFLGLSLAFDNAITFAVIFFPIVAAFLYRIRIEEAALLEAFGSQYLDYMKKTSRFIPGVF